MRSSAWITPLTLAVCLSGSAARAGFSVDFEDLPLSSESYYNGADGAGGFTSRGAEFNNSFTDFGDFEVWDGWSYSNITDAATPGFGNQYSAYDTQDGGGDNSANYGIGFAFAPGDATIVLPEGASALAISLTNTTYAALSMLNGDGFAKKFGGDSGFDPDYFLLTITGFDANGSSVGAVDFYLADYRAAGTASDYVVDLWTRVDLTSLAAARVLSFGLETTDVDPTFGPNTPMYFAADNLLLASVPEPSQAAIWLAGAAVAWVGFRRRRKKLA